MESFIHKFLTGKGSLKTKTAFGVIFAGKTRTPVATQEQRVLFSDVEVAEIVHKNIKTKASFEVRLGDKVYKISKI